MNYQKKMRNLLDNAPNQPSKFRTKNCVEINDHVRGNYNTPMSKASLYDCSDVYILVKETKTVVGAGTDDTAIAADKYN